MRYLFHNSNTSQPHAAADAPDPQQASQEMPAVRPGRAKTRFSMAVGGGVGIAIAGTWLSMGAGTTLAAFLAPSMVSSLANWAGPLDSAGAPIATLGASTLASSSADSDDLDGDGLSNKQEIVLGTSPTDFDTDFDGYSDAEEIARQSDPLEPFSVPLTQNVAASLSARGEDGQLRLVITLHEPGGPSRDTSIRIGALAQGNVFSVPIDRFLGLSDVRSSQGSDGSAVTTIDMPISPMFVHANSQVTFFLAAGNTATMVFGSAAKIDIVSDSGELMILEPAQANVARQASQGGGSIRLPIPAVGTPAQVGGWVAGSICYQRSEVIGVNGPRMLHQVVEADCLEGWDSYCSGACALSVGSTYETIDPLALIGG